MSKLDQYQKVLSLWKARGIISALGLVASVSMSFPGKAAIPSDPRETVTGNVAERLAAVRGAVGSLRLPPPEGGERGDAQVEKAQWYNWSNWGNYFNNWYKPWYNFNNWGNY